MEAVNPAATRFVRVASAAKLRTIGFDKLAAKIATIAVKLVGVSADLTGKVLEVNDDAAGVAITAGFDTAVLAEALLTTAVASALGASAFAAIAATGNTGLASRAAISARYRK